MPNDHQAECLGADSVHRVIGIDLFCFQSDSSKARVASRWESSPTNKIRSFIALIPSVFYFGIRFVKFRSF